MSTPCSGPCLEALSAHADAVPYEAAREELEKLVDSNLARCLQLLFGVTLPHRNLDWAATAVRPCRPFVECKA